VTLVWTPGYAGDEHYDSVSLLLYGNGTNGSTTITDSSPSPKTVTAVGNAQISTAQSKFGGASIAFDGTGDFLTVPDTTANDLPGDFTIETWVYFTNYSASFNGAFGALLVGNYKASGSNQGWQLRVNGTLNSYTTINVYTGLTDLNFSAGTLALNTWHHIAASRSGSNLRAFANGTQAGSTVTNSDNFTHNKTIIRNLRVGELDDVLFKFGVNGYIDDLRITKGIARYTSNFTPPTESFPGFTYTPGKLVLRRDYIPLDASYSSVSLLLHGDGPNGSTTITDNSPSPKTVTAKGNAQISTAQSKFGGASLLFDGTADYLQTSSSSDFTIGTGNFTMECWIYPANTNAGYRTIIANSNYILNGTGYGFFQNGTSLEFWTGASNFTNIITATNSISANTWQHVAVVRSGSSHYAFVNGSQVGSIGTNSVNNSSTVAVIGGGVAGESYDFNGYIDDLRITKGVARYTANFTPPTEPFPDRTDG